jgi:HPt (histidine-containing phosphotransfer) domain-containing protein
MQPKPALDLKALQMITDGDRRIESELARLFMQTAERCIGQLRSLGEGEGEAWPRVLHELKGAAANIRAEQLSALCAQAAQVSGQAAREHACAGLSAAYDEVKAVLDPIARRTG